MLNKSVQIAEFILEEWKKQLIMIYIAVVGLYFLQRTRHSHKINVLNTQNYNMPWDKQNTKERETHLHNAGMHLSLQLFICDWTEHRSTSKTAMKPMTERVIWTILFHFVNQPILRGTASGKQCVKSPSEKGYNMLQFYETWLSHINACWWYLSF